MSRFSFHSPSGEVTHITIDTPARGVDAATLARHFHFMMEEIGFTLIEHDPKD